MIKILSKKIINSIGILIFGGLIFASSFLATPKPNAAFAADAGNWQAGDIVSDGVFYNSNAMSLQNIQDFLNQRVTNCDTNGTQMYNSTMTDAQYAASQGWPAPPYVCLKDYYQVPRNDQIVSNLSTNVIPSDAISAAQIIKNAADTYGVNPKVLLVTLQKESLNLLNDTWPLPSQYTKSMGYGCPDTAPCDPQYAGFYNQMSNAARQFKLYYDNASSYRYKSSQTNTINYNLDASCGSSGVAITTQATAGLYNYTPYQPNRAALGNLYGTGDGCSAYGNRNFWRIFTDWFGSTQTNTAYSWAAAGNPSYTDSSMTTQFTGSAINIQPGHQAYIKVTALNTGNQTWTQDVVHLGTSMPNDRASVFADSSWINPTRIKMNETSVSPGAKGTFTFDFKAPSAPGTYYEPLSLVADGITWMNDPGLVFTINVVNHQSISNSANTELDVNQSIKDNSYLLSPDAQSVLRINNGDVILQANYMTVWHTGTSGAVSGLYMQPDGNLVLYSSTNQPIWNSGTSGNPGASLKLQTDGNMVIYSAQGVALWSTGTVSYPDHLSRVDFTLTNAQLLPGQSLLTPDGKYRMVLQPDGNLVVYSPTKALWASSTSGKSVMLLAMQPDGNLVLYDTSGTAIWTSKTSGNGLSTLAMQPDGNLVLYRADGKALWNTATSGM